MDYRLYFAGRATRAWYHLKNGLNTGRLHIPRQKRPRQSHVGGEILYCSQVHVPDIFPYISLWRDTDILCVRANGVDRQDTKAMISLSYREGLYSRGVELLE